MLAATGVVFAAGGAVLLAAILLASVLFLLVTMIAMSGPSLMPALPAVTTRAMVAIAVTAPAAASVIVTALFLLLSRRGTPALVPLRLADLGNADGRQCPADDAGDRRAPALGRDQPGDEGVELFIVHAVPAPV
jgi:hypothetical protein